MDKIETCVHQNVIIRFVPSLEPPSPIKSWAKVKPCAAYVIDIKQREASSHLIYDLQFSVFDAPALNVGAYFMVQIQAPGLPSIEGVWVVSTLTRLSERSLIVDMESQSLTYVEPLVSTKPQ